MPDMNMRIKQPTRKGPNRETVDVKAYIVSIALELTEDQRREALCKWRRGLRMGWIAKGMGKPIYQIECAVWYEQYIEQEPNDGQKILTVRASRSLHLVARRAA